MNAKVFIEKVNKGERNFNNTVVEGIVDLDKINFGPEESITVASITVNHYDLKRHVEINAGDLRELQKCKIPY